MVGGRGEINVFFPSSDLPFASNEPVRVPEFPSFPQIHYPALRFHFRSSFFSPNASPSPRVIPCPAHWEVGSGPCPILRASLSFLAWPYSSALPSCPASSSCLQFPGDEAIQAWPPLAGPFRRTSASFPAAAPESTRPASRWAHLPEGRGGEDSNWHHLFQIPLPWRWRVRAEARICSQGGGVAMTQLRNVSPDRG